MSEFSRFRTLAIILLGATVCSIAFYWWQLLSSTAQLREKTLDHAMQTASRLAVAGAGQTEAVLRNMDAILEDLRHDYLLHPTEFDDAVKRAMRSQPDGLVLQVGVIDDDGMLAYSSLGNPGGVYLGDREHFRVHQDLESGDRFYVSKPVFGRRSNSWSIQLSRRIEQRGRFKGVVVVSISPEYLSRQFARFDLGREDVISLVTSDGIYLSRAPTLVDFMGKAVRADRPFLGKSPLRQGTFRSLSSHEPIQRSFAWQRVGPYPVVITAGIGETDFMAPLEYEIRQSTIRNGLGTLLVALLAGTLAFLIVRLGRQQTALLQSAAIYRSVFEKNASVKLITDPATGQIVDANPAACAFYGYSKEQLLAMPVSDINIMTPGGIKAEMELARSEQRKYFNLAHRLASGEIRQVEVYSGPVQIEGRTLLHSIIHDVTERRHLEVQLRLSEARLRTIFEVLPDGILLVEPDGKIAQWNQAALTLLGEDEEGLQARRYTLLFPDGRPVPREDYPSLRSLRAESVLNNELYAIERPGQPLRWISASARPLPTNAEGKPSGEVISVVDVSRLIELEESFRIAQSVFEATTEGVLVCDDQSQIVSVNPAFTAITGYSAAEVLGRNPKLLASGHHDQSFYRAMYETLEHHDHWEGEIINRRRDGAIYIAWLKIAAIRDVDRKLRRYVALFSDITQKKRQQEAVWYQANYDALTNLPNRILLNDRLQQAIAQATRREGLAGLLYIDLDHFKPVNDTYGHQAGDELLCQVARRIGNCIRDEDTVARIGGDEFLVLLPTLTERDAALRVADKIIDSLCQPFRLKEATVDIAASIGIALFPEHGTTAESLLEHGDAAMYRAKAEGRRTVRVYSPAGPASSSAA
jgi:diguanylate cyclase (GGDEF)-like protein/PAS domain S-box-containing protein